MKGGIKQFTVFSGMISKQYLMAVIKIKKIKAQFKKKIKKTESE